MMSEGKAALTARTVSTLGHPLVILPAAGILRMLGGPSDPSMVLAITAAVCLGLALLAWGWFQVRRGKWSHIDASKPAERASWNMTAFVVIAIAGLVAAFGGAIAIGMALAAVAAILGVAMLTTRCFKLSQHVAFASLASTMVLPLGAGITGIFVLITALIGWSRLRLARHTLAEVLAGGVAGAIIGGALEVAINRFV